MHFNWQIGTPYNEYRGATRAVARQCGVRQSSEGARRRDRRLGARS